MVEIPKKVEYIIEELGNNGFEAFAVGGCVRDTILGRNPQDWDVTTSASPMDVKRIFKRTIDTGIQHGTVTVMLDKEGFEITTYRIDGEYEDSRHPKEVTFTTNLTEDLKRRDFTINAMAYNPKSGIVDEFGGIEDLNNKIIRCVGVAKERFMEDALRILRAVRFSAQLGFEIEAETREAAKELAPTLKKISRERIQSELSKLVVSPHPDYVKELDNLSLNENIFEDRIIINEYTLRMLLVVRNDKVLRWTALLQEESTAERAKEILRGLKFDNYTINHVSRLTKWLRTEIAPDKASVRHAINQIGEDIFALLLEAKKAFYESMPYLPVKAGVYGIEEAEKADKLKLLEDVKGLYESVIENGDCVSLKQLAVGGNDIIKAGLAKGQGIGELLEYLLDIVLDDPTENERENLLRRAKEYKEV
ncbi:MAG: CCA tRNA nucleotidyltransferase [Lachnospiraceae bacterium]|nr:CCA tRNA nucleotidyltransferase [Lachnospiraceae bacterium]